MTEIAAVVLVEGVSDQVALEALAERLHRDLEHEGVSVVPMGGASAIGKFLDEFTNRSPSHIRVAGLCDEAEIGDFLRGLEGAGFGSNISRSDMESLGFYVCVTDLEDELIRSLGPAAVKSVIAAQGELGSFRTLQEQPVWRGQPEELQLRRFIAVKAGRKVRYGRLLIDALDLSRLPPPLELVLNHV